MGKYQDKRMNIMVNKIGLSERQAEWCLSKHKKYCIWLANQFKFVNLMKNENEVNEILDWKREFQNVNLNELTYHQALQRVQDYRKSLFIDTSNGLKNTNVVVDCGDYKWVQLLTVEDCREEGSTMGHCIGNNSHSKRISNGNSLAFSLRDKYNRPHITLEARKDSGVIFEFKGAANGIPKKNYMAYFYELQKKYKFKSVTDYYAKEAFKKVPEIVEKIDESFAHFFDFNFKISIGLVPFREGGYYMNDIQISSEKPMVLGSNSNFYVNVELESKEITLNDNIKIGGDLVISCSKFNVGENIGVGGNITIHTKTKKEAERIKKMFGKNINCFGKFICEKR
jgi:hypothetical protein